MACLCVQAVLIKMSEGQVDPGARIPQTPPGARTPKTVATRVSEPEEESPTLSQAESLWELEAAESYVPKESDPYSSASDYETQLSPHEEEEFRKMKAKRTRMRKRRAGLDIPPSPPPTPDSTTEAVSTTKKSEEARPSPPGTDSAKIEGNEGSKRPQTSSG